MMTASHGPSAAPFDRRLEDQDLGPEPTGGRHAGQRDHERGHADGQDRRRRASPAKSVDAAAWAARRLTATVTANAPMFMIA